MSSLPFSNASITKVEPQRRTPILMDQVTIALRVYQRDRVFLRKRPRPEYKQKAKQIFLNDPLVNYVSDPRLYFQGDYPAINVCGRWLVASNSVRIFRADTGNPIPHCPTKCAVPQARTIERYENLVNQFKPHELSQFIGEHPHHVDALYRYSLGKFLDVYASIRSLVVKKENLARFNEIGIFPNGTRLQRLELYFEIPYGSKEEKDLLLALKEILFLAFTLPKTNRKRIEESKDEEDRDALLAWTVLPQEVSSKFTSSEYFKIKCYKKGAKVRFEIQANSPAIAKMKDVRLTLENFKLEAIAIADELASSLRVIESHALKILACPIGEQDREVLFHQLFARCKALTPRITNDVRFLDFLRQLAKDGYTDRKSFSSYGLNPQLLKTLANEQSGFLRPQDRGLEGLDGKFTLRKRNPVFVLELKWLSRMGRPQRLSSCGTGDILTAELTALRLQINKRLSGQDTALTPNIVESAIPLAQSIFSIAGKNRT